MLMCCIIVNNWINNAQSTQHLNSPSNCLSRSLHIGDVHGHLGFNGRLYSWRLGDLGKDRSGACDGGHDRRETRGALAGSGGVGGQTS
jgi:hypothetical protein